MNVLIASAWDPRSGVLSVYRALAKHLGPEGVRFSAFAFDGWRDDTLWTFCDELIDGRDTTLAEVLIAGRYDVLHCIDSAYSRPYGVETWVRRSRFRGPTVLMSQLAKRELTAPAHATRYVACSDDAAEILRRDADGEVIVIPNSYDEDVFRPARITGPAPQRPLLVWVGRGCDPLKDVELFLDTVQASPDADAVLLDADLDVSDAIQQRLTQLGPRARRSALLEPHEVAALLCRAAASGGALVCTSRIEGFFIAAAEAMACECPVVAPRIPGLGHLEDGVTAMLYDRADGSEGVAGALERLADGDVRARLVETARREAERRWRSGAMASAYLEIYSDGLREVRSGSEWQHLLDPLRRLFWRVALRSRRWWQQRRASSGGARIPRTEPSSPS
jgi:glycosyltransferase involved in cell wall biosynthesis